MITNEVEYFDGITADIQRAKDKNKHAIIRPQDEISDDVLKYLQSNIGINYVLHVRKCFQCAHMYEIIVEWA